MNETIKGLVIRSTDYREKDKIIDVLTPAGICSATAKGVRSSSAKLKILSGIMTYGDFVFSSTKGKGVLMGGEVIESFFPCWTEPKKYAAAMVCLEITEKLFKNETDSRGELVDLLKTINEIAYGENAIASALWYVVRCAQRVGCDYRVIAEVDPDTYSLIQATADGSEKGVVGASERDLFSALRSLCICFKNDLGFQCRALREAEKLFYRF